tara:strand:+ start:246 stop:398 length:153 start_codon:yes stop_codon:yes gene_type:complete
MQEPHLTRISATIDTVALIKAKEVLKTKFDGLPLSRFITKQLKELVRQNY